MMRSVRLAGIGGPEVVRVVEVPEPGAPRGDELLVRVHASSINGTDLGIRRGALPLLTRIRPAFPLGFDLAGVVVGCGPSVTGFEPGDRVCALVDHGGGAQSELVRVRQGRAARIPPSVTSVDAAALTLAGLTALQGLLGRGTLRARTRPRVLVLGASGGIGAFAVQLAGLTGAAVTAGTSSRTAEFVRTLGAEAVRERDREPLLRAGDGWDIVLDVPGRARFRDVAPALAPGGVLVSTRGVSVDAARSTVRPARGRRFASVRTAARSADLAFLLRLAADGRLRVPVQQVFPLSSVADAHRAADDGTRGKLVLELRAE